MVVAAASIALAVHVASLAVVVDPQGLARVELTSSRKRPSGPARTTLISEPFAVELRVTRDAHGYDHRQVCLASAPENEDPTFRESSEGCVRLSHDDVDVTARALGTEAVLVTGESAIVFDKERAVFAVWRPVDVWIGGDTATIGSYGSPGLPQRDGDEHHALRRSDFIERNDVRVSGGITHVSASDRVTGMETTVIVVEVVAAGGTLRRASGARTEPGWRWIAAAVRVRSVCARSTTAPTSTST